MIQAKLTNAKAPVAKSSTKSNKKKEESDIEEIAQPKPRAREADDETVSNPKRARKNVEDEEAEFSDDELMKQLMESPAMPRNPDPPRGSLFQKTQTTPIFKVTESAQARGLGNYRPSGNLKDAKLVFSAVLDDDRKEFLSQFATNIAELRKEFLRQQPELQEKYLQQAKIYLELEGKTSSKLKIAMTAISMFFQDEGTKFWDPLTKQLRLKRNAVVPVPGHSPVKLTEGINPVDETTLATLKKQGWTLNPIPVYDERGTDLRAGLNTVESVNKNLLPVDTRFTAELDLTGYYIDNKPVIKCNVRRVTILSSHCDDLF